MSRADQPSIALSETSRRDLHRPRIGPDPGSGGLVREPLQLSLDNLAGMTADTFVATLECAGNGRTLFSPATEGDQWQLGAVSTPEWTGVRLDEVLGRAGIQAEATELIFRGADRGDGG